MSSRKKLIDDINAAGRQLSTVSIVFHQAVAAKAGLTGADHKYLDLLFHEGPVTAGRLAELTGLTTGAVTGIIDRLEKRSLVRREQDPNDRRKVLVAANIEKAMQLLAPVFRPLQTDLEAFYDRYSEDELMVIHDYVTRTVAFFRDKAARLRESSSS